MSYRSITGADRRLTTLTRYVVAAGLVTVAVLGPGLATLPLDDPAVWVTAIATVPFLTLITPRFDRYWTNLAGCLYAVTWATVLVSVTGGWQSHFTFLYVVIVVLQGAFFSAMAMAAHVLVVRLRTSEASFRLLAENATDVVYRFQLGEDPGFQYVSPAIRDITGYSPATAARLREADESRTRSCRPSRTTSAPPSPRCSATPRRCGTGSTSSPRTTCG